MIKRILLIILLISIFTATRSQNLPIGGWRDCLPYRFATGVVQGNGKIYCITSLDIFSLNTSDYSIQKYSKATGLSDIGISTAAYDTAYHVLVIGYINSNIDFLYDNGQIVNVPTIEQAAIIGNRSINNIYFSGSTAYLCCGFGIVALNLNSQLITEPTYYISNGTTNVSVNEICKSSDTIYAATSGGVCYATLNDSLFVPSNWHFFTSSNGIPAAKTSFIQIFNNKVYAVQNTTSGANIYKFSNNAWVQVNGGSQSNWAVNGVSASTTDFVLAEYNATSNTSELTLINSSGNSSYLLANDLGYPMQAIMDKSQNLWIADNYFGLLCLFQPYKVNQNGSSNYAVPFTPNGPYTAGDNAMAAYNGTLYVAPDNLSSPYSSDGFFVYNNNTWTNYNAYTAGYQQLANITEINSVIISPVDYTAYFGTYYGMLHFVQGSPLTIYNTKNSTLQYQNGNPGAIVVSGFAYDNENDLWVSNLGATNPISEFVTPSSGGNSWTSFLPNVQSSANFYSQMAVDQFDQKWVINGQGGILVTNASAANSASQNVYKALGTGVGNGNLPSSQVTSIAVDQLGNVWVGTNEGITVFYCPGNELTSSGCDAQQIIYSTPSGNGYLLGTDVINAIVIDGANRKWVGTNTGLYLLSADGLSQIENFTAQNSPLYSNNILSLALDPVNGDLFIGTDKGIEEYRTNATEGSQTNCDVTVFPDPVRQNYFGPITISGVVANATVKITDINGDLVYETIANGGQATWNGNMQNGSRAKTGVYLVFVSNSDGSVHCTGKFLLIN